MAESQENRWAPYTYYLRWSDLGLQYYGVKYGKKAYPHLFWKKYFSSSKKVKALLTSGHWPDVVRVHKTFTTKKDAVIYEHKFLVKVDAANKNGWLNLHPGYSSPNDFVRFFNKAHRKKLSIAAGRRKGETRSEEAKLRMSAAAKKRWQTKPRITSEKTKKVLSKKMLGNSRRLGIVHTEEAKQKMRDAWAKRKQLEKFCNGQSRGIDPL